MYKKSNLQEFIFHDPLHALPMRKHFNYYCYVAILCLLQIAVFGQKDSLVMTNGDILTGELKSMDKGVLYIETPYSAKDFKVKWKEVRDVNSTTRFLVTLQDGRRINTTLQSNAKGEIVLLLEGGSSTPYPLKNWSCLSDLNLNSGAELMQVLTLDLVLQEQIICNRELDKLPQATLVIPGQRISFLISSVRCRTAPHLPDAMKGVSIINIICSRIGT